MPLLQLTFLGAPQVRLDERTLSIGRSRALALLTYLAVTARPHRRDSLVALLWPEYPPASARTNLRRDLSYLRSTIGPEWLHSDRQEASLNMTAGIEVDANKFRSLQKQVAHHNHEDKLLCPTCLSALEEMDTLYQDEFLSGFSLIDSPAFDDWLLLERETLRADLTTALRRLSEAHCAAGDLAAAIPVTQKWLALDVLNEVAVRALLQIYGQTGQQTAARRLFESTTHLLSTEIGTEPEVATQQLWAAIQSRKLAQPSSGLGEVAIVRRPEFENRRPTLPRTGTPFVGREAELDAVQRLLAEPHCQILTIIGPGGMGKTRLAVAVGEEANRNGQLAQGVCFVPLASVDQAEDIALAIATALDFSLEPGERTPEEQIQNYLAGKRLLLILDNFEQLLMGAMIVEALAAAAPALKIVVTSREKLGLQREQLFPIQGLEFPDWETPDDAVRYAAVQLFLQSAMRVRPDFQLRHDGLKYLSRIGRLVQGMPLALELAAAWVDLLSLEEIAAEIQASLDFLSTTRRDVPARHRSMRAVFISSWQTLPQDEQALFAMLTYFRGGFTREAATVVTGITLAQLSRLASKSLIRFDPDHQKYDIHELLRQFGEEQIGDNLAAVRFKHSQYYCQWLASLANALTGREQHQASRQVLANIDNVALAWQVAVAEKQADWLQHALRSLLVVAELAGFQEPVRRWFMWAIERWRSEEGPPNRRLYASLMAHHALLTIWIFRHDHVADFVSTSLNILTALAAEDHEVNLELALAYFCQGLSLEGSRDHRDETAFRQAFAYLDGSEDRWLKARVLHDLGRTIAVGQGLNAGEPYLQAAWREFREIGDEFGESVWLSRVAYNRVSSGNIGEGVGLSRRSVALMEGKGRPGLMAYLYMQFSLILIWNGELQASVNWGSKALEKFELLGDPGRIAIGHGRYATALFHAGEIAAAASHATQAMALGKTADVTAAVGLGLELKAEIAFLHHEYEKALQLVSDAMSIYDEIGLPQFQLRLMSLRGRILYAQGDLAEAQNHLYTALGQGLERVDVGLLLSSLAGIAYVLFDHGEQIRAFEISGLLNRYSVMQKSFKYKTQHERVALLEARFPDIAPAALARGRQQDIWILAAELLAEFTDSS